jgi:hypothetical protein
MVFPFITFTGIKGGTTELSDIEYMAIKAFNSKVVVTTGAINAVTNTISYTVPSGKTAYLAEASIVMTTNPSASSAISGGVATSNYDQIVGALKIDGVTKDKAKIGKGTAAHGGGSGFGLGGKSYFNVLGLSLAGDGSKTITIENILDAGSADASFTVFLETTGTSPKET